MNHKVFFMSSRKSQNSYEWINPESVFILFHLPSPYFLTLPLLLPLARVTNNSASNFIAGAHLIPIHFCSGRGRAGVGHWRPDQSRSSTTTCIRAREMEGWRDTDEESGLYKIFRRGYFSVGVACDLLTWADVIRGWSREKEYEKEGEVKKNTSPSLFLIKRLNPISDSLVSGGDRIEHGR